jgi:cell division protein FtsB
VQADARYIGDLQPHHFNSPRKAKRHINMITTYVDEQKQQIKKLKTENTKLITKINNLDNLLDQLVEKKLLAEERQETVMVQIDY